ncbi:GDSL-type esterase/lipase family protein [Leptothoe sp. LEGE 181152]|nr:GDSL-type esterase/lipase family protein [Leptothoe sp. LEGE 181152]
MANRFLKSPLTIPYWAALSLMMNGVLFIALLVIWQDKSGGGDPTVLPQANAAYATDPTSAIEPAALETQPNRRRLSYQQWVSLLGQEIETMADKNPDHLTILLGDSLSLWFPAELLPGRRIWMNQGISGEKTYTLLSRLHLLDVANVDTIFLMIGINDLIWGQSDQDVLNNYRDIMDYLATNHPDTQVVVQSILPHGAETATWESRHLLLELPNERIRAMNQALENIADDYDAYYLELYPIFSNGEGKLRPDLTTDGLHLNREGYLVWRAAIALYSQLELP